MMKQYFKNPHQVLQSCLSAFEFARQGGDEKMISMAAAHLAFAQFHVRKYEEGMNSFDTAVDLAKKSEDYDLLVQVLAVKVSAFQHIGRLPDAYKTAVEIQNAAEQRSDWGVQCDAITSQAQILLDSGEQMVAFDKLDEARQLAQRLDDPKRLMNVYGALGNYATASASLDQAEAYFEKALSYAIAVGERSAEMGFLANKGTLLFWQKRDRQAVQVFEKVLSLARELEDIHAQGQALRFLTQSFSRLGDDRQVLEYGKTGLDLVREHDSASAFSFLEALILSGYRLGMVEEADRLTIEAVDLARARSDREKEVNFLLSLSESYLASGQYERALEMYPQVLEGARQLGREQDAAYLTGRIGLCLAELGRLEEAVPYHEEALTLAEEQKLPSLAGEQLVMLAAVHQEKDRPESALDYCRKALSKYASAGLTEEVEKTRRLVAEIEAAICA